MWNIVFPEVAKGVLIFFMLGLLLQMIFGDNETIINDKVYNLTLQAFRSIVLTVYLVWIYLFKWYRK